MAFANERGVRESLAEVFNALPNVKTFRLNGRLFVEVKGDKQLYEVAVSVPRDETCDRVKAANGAPGRKPNNVRKSDVVTATKAPVAKKRTAKETTVVKLPAATPEATA